MYHITQIFIYLVKSLGAIALSEARIEERGLQYDRRWMLCNEENKFITQREFKELALFKIQFDEKGFDINYLDALPLFIPFTIDGETEQVVVWDDTCEAIEYKKGSAWFSKMLSFSCKLFYMPNETKRKVDVKYATNNEITSFSDGSPILIVGQQSLNDLNNKLSETITIDRFRPNLVFDGGTAFDEDQFVDFSINNVLLKGTKPCGRCEVVTINQTTAISGKEPLKTLASYRSKNNKVLFGRNVIVQQEGNIKIGDSIFLH